jgi:hypothetical protein
MLFSMGSQDCDENGKERGADSQESLVSIAHGKAPGHYSQYRTAVPGGMIKSRNRRT